MENRNAQEPVEMKASDVIEELLTLDLKLVAGGQGEVCF